MSDPRLEVMRARCRATRGVPPTKTVPLAGADVESLTLRLLPLMGAANVSSIALALPDVVTDFRVEGRANAAGSGYFVESHPFGGGVIEGYHRTYWAVIADGVSISYAFASGGYDGPDDDGPAALNLWGDEAAVAAAALALAPGSRGASP